MSRGDGVGRIRRRRDASGDSETRSSTQVAKWVPRKNLSRKPKSAEAMELDKEEKAWQHQLYRARQANERAEVRQALKDRQKEIERANEFEERSGERKRKFDVDACREKRAQAEAQVLLDEKKAQQDEILRLTLVASADAAGMDAVAFKAQQEGISLLEAEKAIEEENKSRPATEGQIVTVEEEFEVRSASPMGPSRHRRDASPSDEVLGGFFLDFGPVRMMRSHRCESNLHGSQR